MNIEIKARVASQKGRLVAAFGIEDDALMNGAYLDLLDATQMHRCPRG